MLKRNIRKIRLKYLARSTPHLYGDSIGTYKISNTYNELDIIKMSEANGFCVNIIRKHPMRYISEIPSSISDYR